MSYENDFSWESTILTEMTGNGGSLPTTQRSDVKVNVIAIYREPL
jgi:hypothetical protein